MSLITVKTQQGTITQLVSIGQSLEDEEIIQGTVPGFEGPVDLAEYNSEERAVEVMELIEERIADLACNNAMIHAMNAQVQSLYDFEQLSEILESIKEATESACIFKMPKE